ncbi:hypothetical protein Cantr_01232 [Candida viswanathii]|uniref:Uncharacterized protein n=1 Tax=Candida viswanathii TaxID=5486 RepID=A0A367YI27_9ASCO|nr:hypothetical protein Cantr_01232 [Candida viswanathii]
MLFKIYITLKYSVAIEPVETQQAMEEETSHVCEIPAAYEVSPYFTNYECIQAELITIRRTIGSGRRTTTSRS